MTQHHHIATNWLHRAWSGVQDFSSTTVLVMVLLLAVLAQKIAPRYIHGVHLLICAFTQ